MSRAYCEDPNVRGSRFVPGTCRPNSSGIAVTVVVDDRVITGAKCVGGGCANLACDAVSTGSESFTGSFATANGFSAEPELLAATASADGCSGSVREAVPFGEFIANSPRIAEVVIITAITSGTAQPRVDDAAAGITFG